MDYEEYMRSVLGYNQMPNNIYTNTYNDYYYDTSYLNNQPNNDMLNDMYPEIYRIVYPMVSRICTQNSQREITRDLLDSMTDEIYRNIEGAEPQTSTSSTMQRMPLKNGDVRNPNAKEPQEVRGETRQSNFMLRDLIRILIIREFLRPNRPNRPRPPRPPYDQRPPWRQY